MIIMTSQKTNVLRAMSWPLSRERLFIFALLSAFLMGLSSFVSAGLFTANFTSGLDSFEESYDSVDDAFDLLTTDNLQSALPSYTDISAATGVIDYRGLPMNFSFTANSPFLTMTIPDLGVTEVFQGATRDESKDLLVAYLEGDGADTVDRIQQELARVSAVDPVAGNPGSLMGQLVDADFNLAMSLSYFQFAGTPGGMDLLRRVMPKLSSHRDALSRSGGSSVLASTYDSQRISQDMSSEKLGEPTTPMGRSTGSDSASHQVEQDARLNAVSERDSLHETEAEGESAVSYGLEDSMHSPGSVFGIDISHRTLDLEGETANTETITIDYEYYFDDPLKVLRVKVPLAVTDTEGAKSYHANAGIDFSYPVTRHWSLAPGVSYGVGGSEDLGGGASVNGYSLTSTYRWVHGDYLYTLGNMVGRYQTGSVSLGDYEINPDISNTVFRNGLVVFRPSIVFGLPTMVQFFAIDTRYSGDELFTEHYYEAGFALGLITDEALISEDTFNLGLTYLDSTDADIKGYKINFGYRF